MKLPISLYRVKIWSQTACWTAALLSASLFAPVDSAHACACCSDVGQRYEGVNEIGDFENEILQEIRFVPEAQLIGLEDDAMGLVDLSADANEGSRDYNIVTSFAHSLLTFNLAQEGKERGTIRFPVPAQMTQFDVDTREGITSAGKHGPALYREWRLTGDATLTGLATKGTHQAKVRLILQGRGISCPSASDFKHWSLAVDGQNVQFRLIGELETRN